MRAYLLLLPLLLVVDKINTQLSELTPANFENKVLVYQPALRSSLGEKALSFGQMVLRETKAATEGQAKNFSKADYFNLLSAFLTLRESSATIDLTFTKFLAADNDCEYLRFFLKRITTNAKYEPVLVRWKTALGQCGTVADVPEIDLDAYANEHQLDLNLVLQLHEINQDDQRHRNNDYDDHREEQKVLDQRNLQRIDVLFKNYGTYLGCSLAGPDYDDVMWSVIQHSQHEAMRKYLPVIALAVNQGELTPTPLKMLIDRIETIETGRQIFGSQLNVPLADEQRRQFYLQKYSL